MNEEQRQRWIQILAGLESLAGSKPHPDPGIDKVLRYWRETAELTLAELELLATSNPTALERMLLSSVIKAYREERKPGEVGR